jgi:hypothetical protein
VTDNARKRAARAYQKAYLATPYTQVLREVSQDGRHPLAAQLGRDLTGGDVTVNMDWSSHGGAGPHCLIIGACGEDARTMMAYLATGLRAGQRQDGFELVACTAISPNVNCDNLFENPAVFTEHVDRLFDERYQALKSLGMQDVERARDPDTRSRPACC